MIVKKSKKANIERKKGLFFYAGLLISGALTLVAFEWTTFETKDKIVYEEVEDFKDDVILVMPNFKEEVKMEKPKPKEEKQIEKKPDDTNFEKKDELKDDAKKEKTKDDFTGEGKEKVEIIDTLVKETKIGGPIDHGIEKFPDNMPEFPGGYLAMKKFIGENTKYPEIDRQRNISGKVFVSFVVDEDGNIIDAKVLKSPSKNLANEALKVVNSMPKWKPGQKDGKKVKVVFTLPFDFNLK